MDARGLEHRILATMLELGALPGQRRLINGGDGVLPHNLREAAAGVAAYLEDPAIGEEGLAAHVPGPDFPTGGVVVGASAGQVRVRARTNFEGDDIVVNELPYRVEKGGEDGVIRAIAQLAMQGRVRLPDVQDHSDRAGMRIVIVAEAEPQRLLAALFEQTALEIALTVKHPLRDLIERFVREHRPDPGRLRELADRHGDARRTTLPAGG